MSHLQANPQAPNIRSAAPVYQPHHHQTWHTLYQRQYHHLQDKALPQFLQCLQALQLPSNHIPSLEQVSATLQAQTGWCVVPVDGLIDSETFFGLLSERCFPSTLTIRDHDELGHARDPDIFHELFGHASWLMDSRHAQDVQRFGTLGVGLDTTERALLQRLFWFTYEVGLLQTAQGVHIYGGSLLSSYEEAQHAVSAKALTQPFDLLTVLRTPYRADVWQPIYFVMDGFATIHTLLQDIGWLHHQFEQACALGEYPARFVVDDSIYVNVGHCQPTLEKFT